MSDQELNRQTRQLLEQVIERNRKFSRWSLTIIGLLLVATLALVGKSIAKDAAQDEKIANVMTYDSFMEYMDLLDKKNKLDSKQIELNTIKLEYLEKEKIDDSDFTKLCTELLSIDKQMERINERINYIERNYEHKNRGKTIDG